MKKWRNICLLLAILLLIAGCQKQTNTKKKTVTKVSTEQSSGESSLMSMRSFSDQEMLVAAEKMTVYAKKTSANLDQIWAGVNPAVLNCIITNGDKMYYIAKTGFKEVSVEAISEKEVQSVIGQSVGGYGCVTYEGNKVLLYHPVKSGDKQTEDDLLKSYETTCHESFHMLEQDKWQGALQGEVNSQRGTVYPMDSAPRELRLMIYQNLYLAETKPQEQGKYLGQAKYWYEKWKKTYPEEVKSIRETDIAEGTADYFGKKIVSLLRQKSILKELLTPEVFAERLEAIDIESYFLGTLAIHLAKERSAFDAKWITNQGRTPVDVLLEGVKEVVPKEDDTALREKVQKAFKAMNQSIGEKYDQILKDDQAGKNCYLALKLEGVRSSFTASGFYVFPKIGKNGIADFIYQVSSITIKGAAVLDDGQYVLIPVKEQELQLTKDQLTIDTERVSGKNVSYQMSTDKKGNKIYALDVS